jgi:hypothetical protein
MPARPRFSLAPVLSLDADRGMLCGLLNILSVAGGALLLTPSRRVKAEECICKYMNYIYIFDRIHMHFARNIYAFGMEYLCIQAYCVTT